MLKSLLILTFFIGGFAHAGQPSKRAQKYAIIADEMRASAALRGFEFRPITQMTSTDFLLQDLRSINNRVAYGIVDRAELCAEIFNEEGLATIKKTTRSLGVGEEAVEVRDGGNKFSEQMNPIVVESVLCRSGIRLPD